MKIVLRYSIREELAPLAGIGVDQGRIRRAARQSSDAQRTNRFYARVKNAEDREQKRSLLVAPMAKAFNIPPRVLLKEDLTQETLNSLRERFGFDPAEVEKRGEHFHF